MGVEREVGKEEKERKGLEDREERAGKNSGWMETERRSRHASGRIWEGKDANRPTHTPQIQKVFQRFYVFFPLHNHFFVG